MKTLCSFLLVTLCACTRTPMEFYEPLDQALIKVRIIDLDEKQTTLTLPLYSRMSAILDDLNCPQCDLKRLNPNTILKDGDLIILMPKQASCVSINQGSAQELDSLEGIGPALAQRIIADRVANGYFQELEDIMRIKGIKGVLFNKIQKSICL